jgi:hypothetical protein
MKETKYQKLISLLDDLIDEVGEDESHPLASLMEIIGLLIESYESSNVPELNWRNLPSDKQQQVLQFVESLDQHKQKIKQRPFGLCKGEFVVSNGFNEPLPDEILDLFI